MALTPVPHNTFKIVKDGIRSISGFSGFRILEKLVILKYQSSSDILHKRTLARIEVGDPRPNAFHDFWDFVVRQRCHLDIIMSIVHLLYSQTFSKDIKGALTLREAPPYQNGWIFGKVPNGGGSFPIQKFLLQILDFWTGFFGIKMIQRGIFRVCFFSII